MPVSEPPDHLAQRVVAMYRPAVAAAHWSALGSAGGFSGARLWRGVSADGQAFCLKVHPPAADAGRLERAVHRWMAAARAAGLDFVPAIERSRDGRTVVEVGGRACDVTTWMPGRADFHLDPSDAKLVAAVTAVARLHEAWAIEGAIVPCPAVVRRWKALREWEELVQSGWRPRFEPGDPIRPHAESAWGLLPAVLPSLVPPLTYWLKEPVPVQPCLCDVWHDHVLFEGDRVTGVIDFAAAKVDHAAVDLARLLGSLIPDDRERTAAALRAYQSVRPLPQPELVALLDRTGVVAGITNWLRWLYHEGREYPDWAAVALRVAALVRRLEGL
jgi:Ser/Thr protein kinase RdoA (MazF antagonist)